MERLKKYLKDKGRKYLVNANKSKSEELYVNFIGEQTEAHKVK